MLGTFDHLFKLSFINNPGRTVCLESSVQIFHLEIVSILSYTNSSQLTVTCHLRFTELGRQGHLVYCLRLVPGKKKLNFSCNKRIRSPDRFEELHQLFISQLLGLGCLGTILWTILLRTFTSVCLW